jgi:dipeptidyl aminopeptidase/acylaminoacyl peptidase
MEIPRLGGYHSFYATKDGIYFIAVDDSTLFYFDFATRKTRQLLKTERTMGFGFSVSSDGRYALLSQWGDYHQDIMLAQPKRSSYPGEDGSWSMEDGPLVAGPNEK